MSTPVRTKPPFSALLLTQWTGIGLQCAQISWWPKHNVWLNSGLYVGYWSPDCEEWYQRRLQSIVDGNAQPWTAGQWRAALKFRSGATSAFVESTNKLADMVLCKDFKYWNS